MSWRQGEELVAAVIAARAEGACVLLGEGPAALVRALVVRTGDVFVVLDDALEAVRLAREGEIGPAWGLSVGVARAGDPASLAGVLAARGADTGLVDVEGVFGDCAAELGSWLGTARLLVAWGRRADARPGRGRGGACIGPQRIGEIWREAGRDVSFPALPDPERYLVLGRARGVRTIPGSPEPAPPSRRGAPVPASPDPARADAPVTVVVPSAGRSPWLLEAVRSALDQTLPPSRVLVVADGCEDRVRASLEEARLRVDVLGVPARGQAAAMNAALAGIDTPYVAWLDDDDRFAPRKLELQLAAFERESDAVLSASDALVIDGEGTPIGWHTTPALAHGAWPRALLAGSQILGPTVLARTSSYRALGERPHDETLERAADHAMWLELSARGAFHVLPLPLTSVRRHDGNRASTSRVLAMRASVRRTLAAAIERWPIQHFFPAVGDGEDTERLLSGLLERADRLLRVGLVDLALGDVERAGEIGGEDVRVLRMRALLLLERGELPRAREAFERASVRGAARAETFSGLGTIAWFEGDPAGALRAFERAAALDPASTIARYNLARVELGEHAPGAAALLASLAGRERLGGYLLSPWPPADRVESILIACRRREAGLLPSGDRELDR